GLGRRGLLGTREVQGQLVSRLNVDLPVLSNRLTVLGPLGADGVGVVGPGSDLRRLEPAHGAALRGWCPLEPHFGVRIGQANVYLNRVIDRGAPARSIVVSRLRSTVKLARRGIVVGRVTICRSVHVA